jgi:hypothetical protein
MEIEKIKVGYYLNKTTKKNIDQSKKAGIKPNEIIDVIFSGRPESLDAFVKFYLSMNPHETKIVSPTGKTLSLVEADSSNLFERNSVLEEEVDTLKKQLKMVLRHLNIDTPNS